MRNSLNATIFLVCTLVLPHSGLADEFEDPIRSMLERITSGNEEARLQARFDAPKIGAPAIAPLGNLMIHDDVNVRVAARAAIELIVHHAGRPGGVEERGAVCAELVTLFEMGSDDVTRESAHLLGYIAGDRSVPAIAELLNDADENTRETARLTLERIPGDAAIDALLDAVETSDENTRSNMLYSLSKKGMPRAVPTLEKYAREGSPRVRSMALEGLARMGVESAASLFDEALAKPSKLDRGRLIRSYLLLADVLNESVNRDAASAIFRKVLRSNTDGYLREHALLGLCPAGSSENIITLLASLNDRSRRVRRLAFHHVQMLKDSNVGDQIRDAYANANPADRPALLRALAVTNPDGARVHVSRATRSDDLVLRIVALDLTGKLDQPQLIHTYLKLAENGDESVRPVAIKGYLATAQGELVRGKKDHAIDMFRQVIEVIPSSSLTDKTRAVEGLVESAELRSVDTLSALVSDNTLANDAARGVIKLARVLGDQGKTDAVVPHVRALLTSAVPQEIVVSAAETLEHLGVDPQAVIKTQGFLLDWMLTTPIMDDNHTGFDTAYFPEDLQAAGEEMGFDDVHLIGPRRVRWRPLDQLTEDGSVNLITFFRRTQNCLIYGHSELHSDSDRDVRFKIGSDDTIKCWVNGAQLLANGKPHAFEMDGVEISVRLKKGKNTVLIKVTQSTGPWAFSFRITDAEGHPIDSTTLVGR